MVQPNQYGRASSYVNVSVIFKLYHLGIAMLPKWDPLLHPYNIRKLPFIWLLVSCTHLHFYGQRAIPYLTIPAVSSISTSSVFTATHLQEAVQCVFSALPRDMMGPPGDTAPQQHPCKAILQVSTVSSTPDMLASTICGTKSAPSMSNCAQAKPWPQPWHSRPQKISMLVSVYKAISTKKTTKAQLKHKRMTQIRPQVNPVLRATNRFLYVIYVRSNGLIFQYTWNFFTNCIKCTLSVN